MISTLKLRPTYKWINWRNWWYISLHSDYLNLFDLSEEIELWPGIFIHKTKQSISYIRYTGGAKEREQFLFFPVSPELKEFCNEKGNVLYFKYKYDLIVLSCIEDQGILFAGSRQHSWTQGQ